ncbi:catechol 2,3-dioxygenase-like lactoylglutathione lyase family enzyme [Catenuloplanes nepalensis]|uniref:Catechol 2,3-dioxygenase-like lactoylglutathione lyase family enzyme n=1 Tax=Catenuloplanes nepalensis TaxID=587533 RepID=A0ABT9MVU9_9ACTN|nr:VOC family protein [Catenuloplanes nepalensis]MDP9795569.1 catechol 2,3-dioxygenase-like lactoylglutathione lyase family enzyme [Catenuloplanes nepalensis]
MAIPWTLCFDAADPQRLAGFWAVALGYVPEPGYDDPDGASIVDPDGRGPAISFLRVPEGKATKNRVHVDVRPTGAVKDEAAIRRLAGELIARGAVEVGEERYDGVFSHVILRDPEGNEFCVA